jgi:excisionase family DNA binding protein
MSGLGVLDPGKRACLTVEEAAKVCGISRAQAYRRVADGTLPSIRFGPRSIRVPVAALAKLLSDDQSR